MGTPEPQIEFQSSEGTNGPGVRTTEDAADNNSEPWYSARCVFLIKAAGDQNRTNSYEERIILLRADTFDEAFAKAEEEAKEYIMDDSESQLLFVEVYHLFERKISDQSEIFSLIRDSSLSPEDYVRQHFNTGHEYRQGY